MRWLFGVIGLVIGAAVGGIAGAALGAVLGFGFGLMVTDRPGPSNASAGPRWRTDAEGRPVAASQPGLASRVEKLELELQALRRELAAMRSAMVAGESETTAPHRGIPAIPANEAIGAKPGAPEDSPGETGRSAALSAPPAFAIEAGAPAEPTAAAPPPSHQRPMAPDEIGRLWTAARDWLLGGNSVVRVGILILFFGVAFLLKYASDNSLLPVELRMAGVAAGAVVLLGLGWWLRERRPGYALVLQGGGIGVLYLTVFAATRLYGLLPPALAFPLLVVVCALAAGISILQDAPVLAVTGSVGGFLAPVLISTGAGSHVALFSYYALLNAGILAIAWFRAWRSLNLLGFVFTFVIGTAWGVLRYERALFATTEPFLVLFFLMYTGISLLYALRRRVKLLGYVDGPLVFGTPLVAIGLQSAMVRDIPFAMAWSALALAAYYLALAAWLLPRRARLGLMFESMLALGVIFATLVVPLAFDGQTTSAVWAVEGAAIVWAGLRQRRRLAVGTGLVLQLLAGGALLSSVLSAPLPESVWPMLNNRYLGTLLLALAGIFSGWQLQGQRTRADGTAALASAGPASAESSAADPGSARPADAGPGQFLVEATALSVVAGIWGLLWWLGGAVAEIDRWATRDGWTLRTEIEALAALAVATGWLSHLARRLLAWPLAGVPSLALGPVLGLLALSVCFVPAASPLGGAGALVWLLAFAAAYLLLWRQQREAAASDAILGPVHAWLFWVLCALLSTEAYWRLRAYVPEGAWSWSAWAFGYGGLLALLAAWGWRLRWPVVRYVRAYLLWGAAPLAVLLWLWTLASIVSDGNAAPLPYVPLINPLDVAQALALLSLLLWGKRLSAMNLPGTFGASRADWLRGIAILAAGTVFLWLNAVLLRTLHHWAGVPYTLSGLTGSTLVQASLSVFWAVLALVMMVTATRRAARMPWWIGGVLLIVTVAKLFLLDLSFVRGMERIVAFIGIGVLLLLIGYFSPLPPKAKESA
ncbi:hypothetical protein LMG31506_03407 [Cupriavidus yeoncheonensis]|uniref:DUF2339 domain-containing protein n=1 Tax=Cupriavidus yeoncheonensis TaxID=1462994 RepID=A0A916MVY8_9BURK|nr:DUF2339 domain-containing protein [Cupriavidus yeoncheonensis]CAG2146421.1 hypothetical protein LMG31506_03407 [Cupriavidus yeoncheonensis]